MEYGFDQVIDRYDTASVKFDLAQAKGYDRDVLPMWVADMDFPAPECVRTALQEAVRHGIFGYSILTQGYFDAVKNWFARHFDWQIQQRWLLTTPGVVFALAVAVRAVTEPGDCVLIQPPVYHPFYDVVQKNGRTLVESPLVYTDGKYAIDFADLEKKIADNNVKLFILCSPHNPVCRVWTVEELQELGRICYRHGVTVVSDEIHCDFAFPGHPHTPFVKACPEMEAHAIVCTAPSKSFNIAGLQVSNVLIPGEDLHKRFQAELEICAYSEPNQLGMIACQAAYQGGEAWLEACKAYMRENLAYVRDYLAKHMPKIKLVEPEGTYFAWLDCRELGMTKEELDTFFLQKAKIWLGSGSVFGECAAQFQRMVLACPRKIVEKAMEQLKNAYREME